MQAPGRQAGWKRICQEEPPLSPKVTRQQLRPEEPGWLSRGLGGICGDLRGWETQATACPAGTSRAGLQTLTISGSVVTKGVQDPTLPCFRGSAIEWGLRQGGGWLPGSVGALQPQPTKTQEAPKNSVQGFFPTNYSDCWLWSIQSSRPHPKGCWFRLPSNQCLEWAPPCAQPLWELFVLIV